MRPLLSIAFPQGFRISKHRENRKTLPFEILLSCQYVKVVFTKNVQIGEHFFPLLLPKDSKSLKKIGHPTSGSGGKKTFKRYLKSEQTDRHTTDTPQTDGRTFRLIESIDPEG